MVYFRTVYVYSLLFKLVGAVKAAEDTIVNLRLPRLPRLSEYLGISNIDQVFHGEPV